VALIILTIISECLFSNDNRGRKENPMTLSEKIRQFQKELIPDIPKKVLSTLFSTTDELVRSGLAEKSLRRGNTMPSFTLPNASGEEVSSDGLLQKGPLVISFYRGNWCPYCNLELKALQDHLPQIREYGAQLIAISPQLPDESLTIKEKHSLDFEVLSDVGNHVARQFGLVYSVVKKLRAIYKEFGFDIPEYNGDESYELPFPATYIVGQDGTILQSFVDADYTRRMEPADIVEYLRLYSMATSMSTGSQGGWMG
jgi:peroxiredoxin